MKERKNYLYEVEVADLKLADRKGRILRGVKLSTFEIALLSIVFSLFGPLSIIGYTIVLFFLFPSPIIIVPTKYRITNRGVIHKKGKIIPIKKGYKLTINEKRNYVSINYPGMRGEFLRLYSPEPKNILEILEKLRKSAQKFI